MEGGVTPAALTLTQNAGVWMCVASFYRAWTNPKQPSNGFLQADLTKTLLNPWMNYIDPNVRRGSVLK